MTAGSAVRPAAIDTDRELIGIQWTTNVVRYPSDPVPLHNFRCDFGFIEFEGGGSFVTGIQNVTHIFEPGQRFANQVPVRIGPGLYASDQTDWAKNRGTVSAHSNPEHWPRLAHCYENIDNLGTIIRQVYSRSQLTPPLLVNWELRRARRRNVWDMLARRWSWTLSMGVNQKVSGFVLTWQPIATFSFRKRALSKRPLTLWPEFFDNRPLAEQPTEVRFSGMRALTADGFFDLKQWVIEVEHPTQDPNVGWAAEGRDLVSRCGVPGSTQVGTRFTLA